MSMHVSLGFAQLSDADLNKFAVGVVKGLTGNGVFPAPTVPVATLDASQKAFEVALAATNGGGTVQTVLKDQARDVLVGQLRQNALYVEDTADGDEAKALTTGYKVNKGGHHPQSPMDKAVITAIVNEVSGQLLVRLQPQTNAIGYEGQSSIDGGKTWQSLGTFPQARRIVVPNLTPGTTYTFHFRALGGSTGQGDWSDPVSHMCM
jgi:hypothetical protein